jgi:hypothetical protein
MKLGSGIRVAIAAATLLAQLVLPVAHGFGQVGERTSAAGTGAAVSASSQAAQGSPHDPNQCPTCVALSHARIGVGRVLTGDFLTLAAPVLATPIAPACAMPRSPELATASPRAPPVLPLFFA